MNVKKIQRNCINVLDNNRVFGESGFAEIQVRSCCQLWRWAEIPRMSCWVCGVGRNTYSLYLGTDL